MGMESNPEAQNNTQITKIDTNDFELGHLKTEIAKILKNYDVKLMVDSKLCQSLKCKCIATQNDFSYSHSNTMDTIHQAKDKRMENDVSNACLTLVRFLMLDGRDNVSSNLKSLREESEKFLDKQRGSDETMIEVIYPAYVRLFNKRYQQLKFDSNYTDTFIYDQRISDVISFLFTS